MKQKLFFCASFLFLMFNILSEEVVTLKDGRKAVLYDDNTWAFIQDQGLSSDEILSRNRSYLRSGISATEHQIRVACEMHEQGWRYTMPQPKSSKAAWGVADGRTTWYNGWWYNSKTGQYSDTTPQKTSSGLYLGDGQNSAHTWRNGGTPGRPDIFMFLLSESGGPRT